MRGMIKSFKDLILALSPSAVRGTKPSFSDVDVAVEDGVIRLYGNGDNLIADLPGDEAQNLLDGLRDGLDSRESQLKLMTLRGREVP